jgi:hypothetical protein
MRDINAADANAILMQERPHCVHLCIGRPSVGQVDGRPSNAAILAIVCHALACPLFLKGRRVGALRALCQLALPSNATARDYCGGLLREITAGNYCGRLLLELIEVSRAAVDRGGKSSALSPRRFLSSCFFPCDTSSNSRA